MYRKKPFAVQISYTLTCMVAIYFTVRQTTYTQTHACTCDQLPTTKTVVFSIKLETRLADKVTIKSRQGDHPSNLILADYHAGTVYNGFWLNNLIEQLNQGFKLQLSPLSEEEILRVILPVLSKNE